MLPPGGEGSNWMNWDRWNLEPRRASEARGEFWVSGTEGELLKS